MKIRLTLTNTDILLIKIALGIAHDLYDFAFEHIDDMEVIKDELLSLRKQFTDKRLDMRIRSINTLNDKLGDILYHKMCAHCEKPCEQEQGALCKYAKDWEGL